MYNRYIPRPDGSYACNRVPDPQGNRSHKKPSVPTPKPEDPPKPPRQPREHKTTARPQGQPLSFLRNLVGKDFDTGDLVVILLLLLMAGDCEEDRNHALLTIALYFMM